MNLSEFPALGNKKLMYPLKVFRLHASSLLAVSWDSDADGFFFSDDALKPLFYEKVDLAAAKDLTKLCGLTMLFELNDGKLVLYDAVIVDKKGDWKHPDYFTLRDYWAEQKLDVPCKPFCGYVADETTFKEILQYLGDEHFRSEMKGIDASGFFFEDAQGKTFFVETERHKREADEA